MCGNSRELKRVKQKRNTRTVFCFSVVGEEDERRILFCPGPRHSSNRSHRTTHNHKSKQAWGSLRQNEKHKGNPCHVLSIFPFPGCWNWVFTNKYYLNFKYILTLLYKIRSKRLDHFRFSPEYDVAFPFRRTTQALRLGIEKPCPFWGLFVCCEATRCFFSVVKQPREHERPVNNTVLRNQNVGTI